MNTMLSFIKRLSSSVAQRLAASSRDRNQSASRRTRSTLLENLEARQLLSASITMDSVTLQNPANIPGAPANTVTNSSIVNVTAHGVTSLGDTLSAVIFFLDTNNNGIIDNHDKPLIGSRRLTGSSDFLASIKPGKLPVGTDTILVRAVDKKGRYSSVDADPSHTLTLSVVEGPAIDSFIGPTYINTLTQPFNLVVSNARVYTTSAADPSIKNIKIASVAFYEDSNRDGIADPGEFIGNGVKNGNSGYQLRATNGLAGFPSSANENLSEAVQFLAVATDTQGNKSPAVKFSTGPKMENLYTDKSLTVTHGQSLNLVTPLVQSAGAKVDHVQFWIDNNNDGIFNSGDTDLNALGKSGYWRQIGGYIIRLDGTATASLPAGTVSIYAQVVAKVVATGNTVVSLPSTKLSLTLV